MGYIYIFLVSTCFVFKFNLCSVCSCQNSMRDRLSPFIWKGDTIVKKCETCCVYSYFEMEFSNTVTKLVKLFAIAVVLKFVKSVLKFVQSFAMVFFFYFVFLCVIHITCTTQHWYQDIWLFVYLQSCFIIFLIYYPHSIICYTASESPLSLNGWVLLCFCHC